MATKAAKDAIAAHFAALFAADIAGGTLKLTALRNNENPEPPRKEADLGKTHVFLQFPPHREMASCIGAPGVPWRETGAFLVHVFVASATQDAVADAALERAKASLRNDTIGGLVDVKNFLGADSGPRFDGNWWGASVAVEYEAEDI